LKILVIHNTSSGYGDGSIYDFVRLVLADGDEACIRTTDGTTPVRVLVQDATDFDTVVASGGDGTVAAVAHHLAYSGVPILPFPAGTANLLANNLMSPMEPHALAKLVREGTVLDFDLGEIEAGGKKFGFGVMAGAGYDATIMNAAKPSKRLLGSMAYFQAAFMNVLPQKSHISIDVDGEHHEFDGLGILLVNFSKIQFDITVTHENEPRDGFFQVVILKAQNAFGLIPVLIAGILDRDGEFPSRSDSIEVLRGREIYCECNPPMHLQFDGEVPGFETPFHAHVLDGAAKFIVSEEGFTLFRD